MMNPEPKRVAIRGLWTRLSFNRIIYLALRVCVGIVFIYASIDKIIHPDQFAEIIQDYEILPKITINGAALWLAWIEVVLGFCLIAGIWVRAASLMVSGLTVIFIIGLSIAFTRGIGLHCGCFSTDPGGDARTWSSLWQEGLLLLACLWLVAMAFKAMVQDAASINLAKADSEVTNP